MGKNTSKSIALVIIILGILLAVGNKTGQFKTVPYIGLASILAGVFIFFKSMRKTE